jgi:hypothetical protein
MVQESLGEEQTAIFNRLRNLLTLSRGETTRLNEYYEGDRRLRQLGLAIPPELQSFTVFLGWPRVTVDGCEQRLDVTGFRLPGQAADSYLWENWQYNDLDELQSWAHTDALALARSYICVGTNRVDPDHPLVTVESPMEMVTLRDPATREVTAALRLYSDQPETGQTASVADARATLYLPNSTHWLAMVDGKWADTVDPDVHNLGVVPVVPMVNRDRATRKTAAFIEGISEMADVIPIAESASRAVTNGQLAQETHAVPHRVLLGATKTDFVNADGSPTGAFDAYMSSMTALANPNAKATQFDPSDMTNFEVMVNMYARLASGVASMPIEYFGLNTQNAPSAEGQRAGETRLIKKAERKQVAFGHAWEAAMRLVLRFRNGGVEDPDPKLRGLEAMWRDAGTPTKAQAADATVKLYQSGLVDWETAQEDLGRTPAQIEQMKTRRQADLTFDTGVGVQAALVDAANADPGLPVAG